MNTSRKLLIAGVAALSAAAMASSALAQASATTNGTANATIIKPITLTAVTPLSFGKLTSGASDGSTTISSSADQLSGTSNLTPLTGISVTRAKFTLNGENAQAYTLTLPTSPVTMTGGTGTVTLDSFTSNSPALTGSDVDLYVGATLHVAAGAGGGARTVTFPVTVAYN